MSKTVDIYMPLDERDSANAAVWPVAKKQLKEIIAIIERSGWTPNVLNPEKPVSSVAEGLKVIKGAKGERFINFIAGWAYPDFTVSPMWQLPAELPKLMLGSILPDFPGAVGLLAAQGGLSQVGIKTSRIYVENFANHGEYEAALKTFLETGAYQPELPKAIAVEASDADRKLAKAAAASLKGSVYGAVGPRSMQMWNKISDADFLSIFGIAREGFDGLRLAKLAEKVPVEKAKAAFEFLKANGMEFKLGNDPKKMLTEEMVVFQMQVYFALLELKKRYGLTFMGVQDQLDWIEHYPATDLTLGILNNKLRPEGDGETVVVSTEADDGAALAMQTLKLLSGGEPAGFNDLRYWKDGLYWFVNSGALAPYFAQGSNDSLEGAWSERQTPMYFGKGGGTCSVVVRKPGVVTWARYSYRNHQLYLCAGRGITDVPTEAQWKERTANCSPDWPQHYIRLCGKIEWYVHTNHPMTAFGDHLGALKALAGELGIPFECYDHCTPEQLA
jgi:L-fucose isomerase-like protein